MALNNEHEIIGTLYGKITRTAEGKKANNMGKLYSFFYYTVEVPTMKTWTTDGKEKIVEKKELIKFKLPMGMSPDDYEVKDHLLIRFTITGHEFDKKDGSGKDVMNENEIKSIKFADIERGKANPVDAPKRDTTFIPQAGNNTNNDDDLPF